MITKLEKQLKNLIRDYGHPDNWSKSVRERMAKYIREEFIRQLNSTTITVSIGDGPPSKPFGLPVKIK